VSRIDQALNDFATLDALALQRTVLSEIDPRAKILATLGFIVAVASFDRYAVAALLPFAVFPLVMAQLGEIPLQWIARKIWFASPFAVMVGLFNPLLDQQALLSVLGIPVSGGWVSFASLLVRFVLTVAASLVLVAGTGLRQVGAGLVRLGVPEVFTTQLLFLHRYASVLGGETARMQLARELRAGPRNTLPLAVYGALLGHLLLRSLDRAQRIYRAMQSRGYDGTLHAAQPLRWRVKDGVFLAVCLVAFATLRAVNMAHGLGALLLRQLQ
jgi:cobalt/nickel transport system permease protein